MFKKISKSHVLNIVKFGFLPTLTLTFYLLFSIPVQAANVDASVTYSSATFTVSSNVIGVDASVVYYAYTSFATTDLPGTFNNIGNNYTVFYNNNLYSNQTLFTATMQSSYDVTHSSILWLYNGRYYIVEPHVSKTTNLLLTQFRVDSSSLVSGNWNSFQPYNRYNLLITFDKSPIYSSAVGYNPTNVLLGDCILFAPGLTPLFLEGTYQLHTTVGQLAISIPDFYASSIPTNSSTQFFNITLFIPDGYKSSALAQTVNTNVVFRLASTSDSTSNSDILGAINDVNSSVNQVDSSINRVDSSIKDVNQSLTSAGGANSSFNSSNAEVDSVLQDYKDQTDTSAQFAQIPDNLFEFDTNIMLQLAPTISLFSAVVSKIWTELGDLAVVLTISLILTLVSVILGIVKRLE